MGTEAAHQPVGRKEVEMVETNRQVMISAGVLEDSRIPPIIEDIASHISELFEMASEFGAFRNDEDENIIELIISLYLGGSYSEAVGIFKLVFSLIENSEASELLSLIHENNGSEVERQFIEAFAAVSPRCKMNRIRVIIDDGIGEEAQ